MREKVVDSTAWRNTSAVDVTRSFVVVIHDVAPVFQRQIRVILGEIAPRIGGVVVAAVVPCWHDVPLDPERDGEFLRFVHDSFGEFVQHGFSHLHRGGGLVSRVSGGANELSRLSIEESRGRLKRGRALLAGVFPEQIAGFLPPAWQRGRITSVELGRCGFEYVVGFRSIQFVGGRVVALATWSWDWGRIAALGHVGGRIGDLALVLQGDALPCIAIHPIDVDRGYLPRCLGVVDRLMSAGRRAVLFSEMTSHTSPDVPRC